MEESLKKDRIQKLERKLTETFIDEVRGLDEKGLRDKIVNLSKEIEDIDRAKEADADLAALKDKVKELAGAYFDAKKDKTNKLKYVLLLLEEKGKL